MGVLFKASTWWFFGGLTVAATVLPVIAGLGRYGSRQIGFPFTFFESTSAPPPAFGSTFSWKALLLNLAVYYLIAVCGSLLWSAFRSSR